MTESFFSCGIMTQEGVSTLVFMYYFSKCNQFWCSIQWTFNEVRASADHPQGARGKWPYQV